MTNLPNVSRICFALLTLLFPLIAWAATPPSAAPSPGDYAAPETCSQCHQAETDAWSHSDHAWAMRPADETSVLGDFSGAVFDDGAVWAEFHRGDEGFNVRIEGDDGKIQEYPVAYTFGYFPLQQYLVQFPGGRLQALTIAWDSRNKEDGGQRWFSLYPGQSFAPDDALHWTGRYQNWNAMCADCHSTALSMNYNAKKDTFATTWQEQNVGCQSCHGPGKAHVEWANRPQQPSAGNATSEDRGLNVAYQDMSSSQVVETCAYCHSRRQPLKDGQHANEPYLDKALPSTLRPDLYHPDGQIQGEVYVYGSFIQSKMYQAGVSCLDCHDPHTTKLKVEGNALCTQCHNPAPQARFPQITPMDYDSTEHHKHPSGSEGAQCINCHMPEETYMVVDPRRDHSFRIPRPDLTLTTGSPNTCNACHDDKSANWAQETLEKWYPTTNRSQHFSGHLSAVREAKDDAFIRLARLIRDKSEPALARATAADHLGSFGPQVSSALRSGLLSEEPLVQAYAAGAFSEIPSADSVAILASLISTDHPRAVQDQALKALVGKDLSQLPEEQQQNIRAQQEDYEKRLESLSALPGSRFGLATYQHRAGQFDNAIQNYQAALVLDPTFSPARVNLATLASEQGHSALAMETLQVGADLATIPESDRGYLAYLLALVLVESGDAEKALPRFEQAYQLTPENSRSAYNHGLVLAQTERWQEAQQVLDRALTQHPANYDLLNAMIYVLRKQGQPARALDYARQMRSAFPQDRQANQLVRALESAL